MEIFSPPSPFLSRHGSRNPGFIDRLLYLYLFQINLIRDKWTWNVWRRRNLDDFVSCPRLNDSPNFQGEPMFSLRITGWWSLVWGLLSTRLHNTTSLDKNKKWVQSKLTNPNHNPPSSRNAPTSRNSAKARHYSTCTIFMVTSPWQRATFDERNNKK